MSEVLGIHGIECRIPGEWDVAINRGDRRSGYVVLVYRRRPLLNITWDRRPRRPDIQKTLRGIVKRMKKQGDARLEKTEALAGNGLLARFTGPEGSFHVAIFQPDAEQATTMIMRQLSPGTDAELRSQVAGVTVHDASGLFPWRLHEIAVDLPPAWLLQGIQQYPGLVRAVWFRATGKAHRHDQVLVLRRFACAGRMLGDLDVRTWIQQRLAKHERMESTELLPGPVLYADCSTPASNWYKRIRRIRDRRLLHAWIEDDHDRLLIQEWKGVGTPLGPLTQHHRPGPDPHLELAA